MFLSCLAHNGGGSRRRFVVTKAVNLFGRLLLAVTMLVGQLSIGYAACVCLPDPAPLAAAQNCPMSQVGTCACCRGKAKAKCQVKAPREVPPATAPAVFHPVLPGVLLVAFRLPAPRVEPEAPQSRHLVVPRIRPPNLAGVGLRAPPAR